jgi:uncharacterized protein (UPF0212 family)
MPLTNSWLESNVPDEHQKVDEQQNAVSPQSRITTNQPKTDSFISYSIRSLVHHVLLVAEDSISDDILIKVVQKLRRVENKYSISTAAAVLPCSQEIAGYKQLRRHVPEKCDGLHSKMDENTRMLFLQIIDNLGIRRRNEDLNLVEVELGSAGASIQPKMDTRVLAHYILTQTALLSVPIIHDVMQKVSSKFTGYAVRNVIKSIPCAEVQKEYRPQRYRHNQNKCLFPSCQMEEQLRSRISKAMAPHISDVPIASLADVNSAILNNSLTMSVTANATKLNEDFPGNSFTYDLVQSRLKRIRRLQKTMGQTIPKKKATRHDVAKGALEKCGGQGTFKDISKHIYDKAKLTSIRDQMSLSSCFTFRSGTWSHDNACVK